MKLPWILHLVLLSAAALVLPAQEPAAALAGLARIHHGVTSKRISSYDRTGGNDDRMTHIPDGESRTIMDVKGAGVIKHIWFTIGPPPGLLSRNDVILKIYWDGNDEPSVHSPIGPFFGQGWEESYPFTSAPLAAGPKEGCALNSYFPMPFARGARIEIENQTGAEIRALYFNIDYEEVAALPADTGRFHAWFNRQITEAAPEGENEWGVLGPTAQNPDGARNYVVADIVGQGHFAGLNYYVQSPTPMWYGEGDEMLFIDGDELPTIIGTGTEDYFNTAWCPKELYSHPYFGVARVGDDTGWLGRFHTYRFHISDPIHFERSLRFTLEHGHANTLTLDLATVAYWYQTVAVGVPPIPDRAARRPMPFIKPADIHRWRDAWRRQMGNAANLWGNEPAPPAPAENPTVIQP